MERRGSGRPPRRLGCLQRQFFMATGPESIQTNELEAIRWRMQRVRREVEDKEGKVSSESGMIIGNRTLPNATKDVLFIMVFPDYTNPRKKPDVYEANRVDTELAIYKELQHGKICRQTSYEVFSDEESEDDAY